MCNKFKSQAVIKDFFDSLNPEDVMTKYRETSATNHKITLRNIPEDQWP